MDVEDKGKVAVTSETQCGPGEFPDQNRASATAPQRKCTRRRARGADPSGGPAAASAAVIPDDDDYRDDCLGCWHVLEDDDGPLGGEEWEEECTGHAATETMARRFEEGETASSVFGLAREFMFKLLGGLQSNRGSVLPTQLSRPG